MVRFIHRTNYWGTTITGQNRDSEVDLDLIWVQAVSRRHRPKGCCQGFGKRSVRITMDDLETAHGGDWNLFYVSGKEGRNSNHYFHKLVLIPKGTRSFGVKTCTQKHGWTYEGEWSPSSENAASSLDVLLKEYKTGIYGDYGVSHIHIGIHMESCYVGYGNSF